MLSRRFGIIRAAAIPARFAGSAAIAILIAAAFAVAFLAIAVPCGAQEHEAPIVPDGGTTEQALRVLKGFESAWRSGNADALASFLSDTRVFIEIRGMGKRGGYFSRSQALYMFRNLFDATPHMRFEFQKYQNLDTIDRKVYGVAHRSYKGNRGGIMNDRLIVTLSKEGDRWVIVEIKST